MPYLYLSKPLFFKNKSAGMMPAAKMQPELVAKVIGRYG
jgi:hypothetical protein